jgi:hypothetical protein
MVRNRWQNCTKMTGRMNFMITRIYRKGDDISDNLANLGHNTDNVLFFWKTPSCIMNSLYRNKLGLPNFRFTSY